MPPRKGHITYREWRERGETMVGAFIRTVPFEFFWLTLALLAVLSWMGVGYFRNIQW